MSIGSRTTPGSSSTSVIYISSRGIPTPVAHGHGMVKMCEAYANNGVEVELWRPYRFRKNFTNDVFSYYEVAPSFTVRTLGGRAEAWDSERLKRSVHKAMTRTSVWGLFAALAARRRRPLFCHTRDPGIAFWLTRLGVPTVYEAHDLPWRAGRTFVKKLALRFLIAGVGLTTAIRDDLASLGIPEDRLHTIPNGVDLRDFENLPSRADCRARLGLPGDRPIVGYVGRFVLQAKEMEKGIPQLIEAVARLQQERGAAGIHLVCVGGPMHVTRAYEESARSLGVEPGTIRFVDRVSPKEVPYWIRAADVVAIPSPRTPFNEFLTSPLKLFEYMAAGTAIVATELPSVTPFLRAGDNAVLVEPGNPAALADGLKTVLQDESLRRRLADRARADSRDFGWDHRAATILDLASRNEA